MDPEIWHLTGIHAQAPVNPAAMNGDKGKLIFNSEEITMFIMHTLSS